MRRMFNVDVLIIEISAEGQWEPADDVSAIITPSSHPSPALTHAMRKVNKEIRLSRVGKEEKNLNNKLEKDLRNLILVNKGIIQDRAIPKTT